MTRKPEMPRTCTLKLQSFDCSDIQDDLCNWNPRHADNVFFGLNLTVGCKETAGINHFQIIVATHNQTQVHLTSDEKRTTQWFNTYSYAALCKRLDDIIADCSTGYWDSSVDELRKISLWEYEGYK